MGMEMLRAYGRSWLALGLTVACLAGNWAPRLAGQEPGKSGTESRPLAATGIETAPATASTPEQTQALHSPEPYWKANANKLLVDFGDMERFRADDAALPTPAAVENRVVFMGDSITAGWKLDVSFPGMPYINRGISGQTTPQMLLRFRQDVIDLQPKVTVILGGTNDVAGNTGPMTLEQTEEDLASMADLATANHIRVVLCSVTPSVDFWWAPGQEPAPRIALLNAWIRGYAAAKQYAYVDYYSAMKDADGGLPPNLSHDGVHPSPAGYAVMAPLVEAAIEKSLNTGNERTREQGKSK